MRTRLLLICVAFFAAASTAFAQPPAESALGAEHPRPVDEAQERLYRLHHSKRAHSLKLAYDALQAVKPAKARTLAQAIVSDELFGDYALWIVASALRSEAQAQLTQKKFPEAEKTAQRALASGLQIEARDPYSPILKTLPRELGLDELVIGDSLWARKIFAPAEAYYERGFQRLSTIGTFEEVRPDFFLHYSDTCAKVRTDLCVSWMQRFVQLFPRGSQEARAIAKGFPESMDRPRSPHAVTKSTQTYKGPDLDLTAFDAAMALYLDGKYKDTIQKLNQFGDDFPKSTYRFRARYWLTQATNQQQDHDKAVKFYDELAVDSPLTYYGLLAAIANARPFDAQISGSLPLVAETDPFLLPQEVRRLTRAESFIVEQAFDLALIELRDVHPRDGLSNHFLMYLAMLCNEAKAYSASFAILSQLAQRNYEGMLTTYVTRMIFPSPYLDLIKRYASANNLDPILVLALMKQESAFSPTIGSGVGAVGLMQLMPATAVDVDPDVTRSDLMDAEENIRIGTQYLRRLLTQFNGNIVYTLAAYNAGPGAISRWMSAAPAKRGMLEFIETIPYKETREYVTSIIRNYYWYSKILNGDSPKSLNYFWNMYGPPEKLPNSLASSKTAPPAPNAEGDSSSEHGANAPAPGAPALGPAVEIGPRIGGSSEGGPAE